MHRDLKPENILVEIGTSVENLNIKVIDFGASIFEKPNRWQSDKFGTIYYVAPEVLQGRYNLKCDIWSLGVILFILLSGEPPFHGTNDQQILNKIGKGTFEFKQKIWCQRSAMCKDLISKMICPEIRKRISCSDALQHPWIQESVHMELTDFHQNQALMNLKNFTTHCKFQEAALTFIAFQLTDAQEHQEIVQSFKKFDRDGNGTISKDELLEAYKDMYKDQPDMKETDIEHEVDLLWSKIDMDGSGVIDFTEWSVANIGSHLTKSKLKKAFEMFDLDGSGQISAEELQQMMGQLLGNQVSDQIWAEMIAEVDLNGNGEISFDEFEEMMKVLLPSIMKATK